jgi:hypothetical protein
MLFPIRNTIVSFRQQLFGHASLTTLLALGAHIANRVRELSAGDIRRC